MTERIRGKSPGINRMLYDLYIYKPDLFSDLLVEYLQQLVAERENSQFCELWSRGAADKGFEQE